ncbi:hypothetical protein TCON_1730 [Astathelohania contejeani]|uniref:Uncharacterized protein n=1 Tax=Astathelohania contejeani TaxID=164912 RepID=A0ABQ7HY74_9MICR|nr:hypothetical protein TCON_1730 [Thelohania contejeani]
MDLILCTLPVNMKEYGSKLIETSKTMEEERLKNRYNYGRHDVEIENVEIIETIRKKAQAAALPIAIAKLVMVIWSPEMRRHAEKLILQKAVQENYIKEDHLKWVHVLEQPNDDDDDNRWLTETDDNVIVELIWNRFNIKEHYAQVKSHRMWIQKSYDRLKDFIPNLPAEIIERHDLSKFAFSQAIGYTLKWVHRISIEIWKTACDLHLHNEPHHPQTWSKLYTPEEKKTKLEHWMKDVCDVHNGCPYGFNIVNHDLNSEDMAEPFLYESFIDMVAIEWEKRKWRQLDISLWELAYIDDKFLKRYSKNQHQIISKLIEQIVTSDDTWKAVTLAEREKILMTTVPEHRRTIFMCQTELQKKYEMKRLIKLAKIEDDSKKNVADDDVITEEMVRKAHNMAFLIMISKVVVEHWESYFRKHAEEIILKRAIKDKFINDGHLKWIMVITNQKDKQGNATTHTPNIVIKDDVILQLLWKDFNLQEHFSQVKCHRYWIQQSYRQLSRFMPELPEEVIERHDLSMFALSQSIGYTLKWIHNINCSIWYRACDLHINYEPHHPQMWLHKHTPKYKQRCLEAWLCTTADSLQYGVKIASLDLKSENMAKIFLLESLVNMVAIEWERKKAQKTNLTYTELVHMDAKFLSRYSPNDKIFILDLMNQIKAADNE